MKKNLILFIFLLTSATAFSAVITIASDPALSGAETVNFDQLPLGYIKDTAEAGTAPLEAVTFTSDSLTVNTVTFTNGGDTHWFPQDTEEPLSDELKTVEIEGLSINPGEDAWGSGTFPPSPNKILLQRTNESRIDVLDTPGRLNTIKIEFNEAVDAFGLTVGGNQPGQTLKIYNTDDVLIHTTSRPPDRDAIFHFFTGYAIEGVADKKIKYVLWGNTSSHDKIYIDNLVYKLPATSGDSHSWPVPPERAAYFPPELKLFIIPFCFLVIGIALLVWPKIKSRRFDPPSNRNEPPTQQ